MPDKLQHRYLNPQDLARLRHVMFAARRPVEGRFAGRHASPQFGRGIEFSDYRLYMPGDEIADIDWKIYGRTDRLYVKRFEHQSEMNVHLMLDASASMAYGQPDQTKYDHAARLAAAIALLVIQQQDRVGFAIARRGLQYTRQPRTSYGHLIGILTDMELAEPTGEAGLATALTRYANRAGRRGVLILLSDLLDDAQPILDALSRYTARGIEVIVFHVLHADELHLPPDLHDAALTDSETGQRLTVNVDDIRADYQRRLQRFLDGWAHALRARGIDHNLASTATEYHAILQRYLFTRAAIT